MSLHRHGTEFHCCHQQLCCIYLKNILILLSYTSYTLNTTVKNNLFIVYGNWFLCNYSDNIVSFKKYDSIRLFLIFMFNLALKWLNIIQF